MRIPKRSKLGVAMSVLKKINLKEDETHINGYVNGREQGFFIYGCDFERKYPCCGKRPACSFAENRNSDSIIVQYGELNDFDDYGVFVSEEKYKTNKLCFGPDDAEKAGQFITKWVGEGKVMKLKEKV